MIIQYNIVVTTINLVDNSTNKFNKTFEAEVTTTDALLYNNYHVLTEGVYILDMFEDEVNAYCAAHNIEKSSIEIDEFEIVSLDERVDVFFESNEEDNSLSLKPTIKCYVYPKNDALKVPELQGVAYDSTTIIWSWPNDEQYAHYLLEEAVDPDGEVGSSKIIAQLPIGVTSYTETGLNPDTPYTRRLINYTAEQTSTPSASVTVWTETVNATHSLEEYVVPKNYDFTTDDSQREIIQENLPAFHSGIGDGNDLKVYKQMDADFYQKFKAYFELTGRRIQREKRYDQVGFNYKICMEALETIEEQEGEVTFDIDAYPREWVSMNDYMWGVHPVDVKTRLTATVFLRRETDTDETEELQLWEPNIVDEPIYSSFSKKTAIIISVDMSSSMRQEVGGEPRYKKVQRATQALVDAIVTKAMEHDSYTSDTIQYIIVGWASSATIYYDGYDPAKAKETLAGLTYIPKGCTNWYRGLTKGKTAIDSDREVVGQIFFTDGFVNMDENGAYGYHAGDSDATSVINSITKGKENAGCETYFVFGNGANHVDTDYSNRSAAIKFAKEKIVPTTLASFSNCYYPGHNANMDNMTELALADNLISGLKIFGEQIIGYKKVFKGWKQSDETATVKSYSIDEVRAVTITSDIYSFKFDNTVTPVEYDRKEKRAIIPFKNVLPPTNITNTSIYDIIMAKVKQTSEWKSGFNKTIGTTEPNGEPDSFLVKGLFIEDTYNFADEDEITESNFGLNTWEYGMSGSVNTFTDINKAGTTIYGDDCYLVSKNNHLQIQGYTDAIIYDHNRFVRTELNAYDHPSEILISATGVYDNLLTNRKKSSLTYAAAGGVDPLHHAVDIIEKDDDIWLEGYSGLVKPGQWLVISPLTKDLIAHNDTKYESPILNYRFNLEDPDAKTPIYEILPTSNPNANYLHIVFLHVYYARNVYITNKDNYVEQYGDDPVATIYSDHLPLTEDVYQWTLKDWKDGTDNCWYIDNYLWFMAKPHKKQQEYYDELPGEGLETFYGLVNGRYRSDNQDGKQDLRVDTPQFNIPTTVHKDTIKIYIMITEFYPDTALVSYKWEHPLNDKDGITQFNGDYVTFSSDSLTYKDVEYFDTIATINMENQEIFDNKPVEKLFELTEPQNGETYQNYYIEVTTDNADVLPMRYPAEITFDENGLASVAVTFKGVINATSQWAPRIHNGYYYLNQHEYFAYSEFNVEANFDTYEETNYKTAKGYVTFDVQLRRIAPPPESYSILKNTRSELLQDEKNFEWIDNKGLTLKPYIDGEYYKEYLTQIYYSPIILFKNILTTADVLTVDYYHEDNSVYFPMEVRSYVVADGEWSDWVPFTNGTVPNVPLSCAYQVKTMMQASVQNYNISLQDYMCCYLDWKDDMNEANTTNIVTITDHMTTGPDKGQGVYVSKVIDFGCITNMALDLFESNYNEKAKLYIAYTDSNPDLLLLENISWNDISALKDNFFSGRYFRYKIVIPEDEKVYWLHKRIATQKTEAMLPYITGISMSGTYAPEDKVVNFINTEAFEFPKDGNEHVIFERVSDIIGADVIEKGFTEQEIEYINIQCTTENIELSYDVNLANQYPLDYLGTPIIAKSDVDVDVVLKNTPYIRVEQQGVYDIIKIIGTPQQYCPITVEDPDGNAFTQLFNTTSFIQEETYLLTEETKYLELKTNRYDPGYFKVYIDDEELDLSQYKVVNHLVIFNDFIGIGHTVKIEYCILYTFIALIDREANTTDIYLHTGEGIPMPEKCKVYFETNTKNNKFIADDLSLNPIYRTDYKGFIYLTDEHTEPYELKIYCNPQILKAGGYDKVDIAVEVLDIKGNPIVSKEVAIDCEYGILSEGPYITDINGVIHLVYESAYLTCTDTLVARVLTDDNTVIEQSITIINE